MSPICFSSFTILHISLFQSFDLSSCLKETLKGRRQTLGFSQPPTAQMLRTSNCLMPPMGKYRERIWTCHLDAKGPAKKEHRKKWSRFFFLGDFHDLIVYLTQHHAIVSQKWQKIRLKLLEQIQLGEWFWFAQIYEHIFEQRMFQKIRCQVHMWFCSLVVSAWSAVFYHSH